MILGAVFGIIFTATFWYSGMKSILPGSVNTQDMLKRLMPLFGSRHFFGGNPR